MTNVIPIEQAQAAILAKLKTIPNLITALGTPGAASIKEWYWQGDDFVYPAIRLQMGIARAEGEPDCGRWISPFYVMCFSSQKSSKQASQLASIIGAYFHGYQPGILNGVRFGRFVVDQLIPPIRQDSLTWRSEVIVHSQIS